MPGTPSVEVDDRAPWQGTKFIGDYSKFTGPTSDRNAKAWLPGLAAAGPAADVCVFSARKFPPVPSLGKIVKGEKDLFTMRQALRLQGFQGG